MLFVSKWKHISLQFIETKICVCGVCQSLHIAPCLWICSHSLSFAILSLLALPLHVFPPSVLFSLFQCINFCLNVFITHKCLLFCINILYYFISLVWHSGNAGRLTSLFVCYSLFFSLSLPSFFSHCPWLEQAAMSSQAHLLARANKTRATFPELNLLLRLSSVNWEFSA